MAFCSKRGAKLAQVVSQPVVSPMVMVGNSGIAIATLMTGLLGFLYLRLQSVRLSVVFWA